MVFQMPFKSTIQTALRKMSNSYRKDRQDTVLLEPPYLALPTSPKRDEVYYIMDDFDNATITTYDYDAEKTYYENETFYEAKSAPTPIRRSIKRKHSPITVKPLTSLEPLHMSTPHSFCEMDHSPPAKRAPILRRIPLKLDIPLQHPPAIPPKEHEEEHSYMEPICHRIKHGFIYTVVMKAIEE
ncbi:unnamed protein product [Haemonchus placei]|uniref:Pollen-specific leucine-rich repeat extensin-like protein 1 n=1 Tax=Haemonchus placei TaxID=6290 RepID=A0A0N4VT70_HAEPC|nr:unnamed protein product [Haemonchus placei]